MKKAHGQLRRGQLITTWGPGALIDMPQHSAVIGGLETWPSLDKLDEIGEPRLSRKLQTLTDVTSPRLYAPPVADAAKHWETPPGVGAWRFPEWFVVQEPTTGRRGKADGPSSGAGAAQRGRKRGSRRLVPRRALDERRRFDDLPVVPVVFVRACPKGHLDDLDWREFVHAAPVGDDPNGTSDDPGEVANEPDVRSVAALPCLRQLWMDETGTSGDVGDLVVRCECGQRRRLVEATDVSARPLGTCTGARPWLGKHAGQRCGHPARLLVRTASNAYFAQVVSVLSLPHSGSKLRDAVESIREYWEFVEGREDTFGLSVIKRKPKVADALADFGDRAVLETIEEIKTGQVADQPVKRVELDAILSVPEGWGDESWADKNRTDKNNGHSAPADPNFHARRLPERAWRRKASAGSDSVSAGVASVVQLHRLREVLALAGFTRLEAIAPDIHGEYDTDVERADLALEPQWFPAVENRGEGVFLQLDTAKVHEWRDRDAVQSRLAALQSGHDAWCEARNSGRAFPGGPYILLHTLSHLLIHSLAMGCGYPATSIRERIYAEDDRYGILLYTGSPDADGTLGGLVQQARRIEDHLAHARRVARLCSNDPLCAQHAPEPHHGEGRLLLGAACHGCALVAETSCEMRNDYLDRALVVPVIGGEDAAFFAASARGLTPIR